MLIRQKNTSEPKNISIMSTLKISRDPNSQIVRIEGNLTSDPDEMMNEATPISQETMEKIQRYDTCDIDTFNWSSITDPRNICFYCINTEAIKGYCFPLMEEENREHDYKRVKEGIEHFTNYGWKAYLDINYMSNFTNKCYK